MKYFWIDSQSQRCPLSSRWEVLSVIRNGYSTWRRGGTPQRRRLGEGQLLVFIRAIHAEVKGVYGSPRMTTKIRSRDFPTSKAQVEWLMRENDIRARHDFQRRLAEYGERCTISRKGNC